MRNFKLYALVLALLIPLAPLAVSAHDDDDDEGWHEHRWHHEGWERRYPHCWHRDYYMSEAPVYYRQPVYYAPPVPVVVAPQPVYYAPPFFSIVLPLSH